MSLLSNSMRSACRSASISSGGGSVISGIRFGGGGPLNFGMAHGSNIAVFPKTSSTPLLSRRIADFAPGDAHLSQHHQAPSLGAALRPPALHQRYWRATSLGQSLFCFAPANASMGSQYRWA